MQVGAVVVAVGAVAALGLGGRTRVVTSDSEAFDTFAEGAAAA
jgi:hypothetical protein